MTLRVVLLLLFIWCFCDHHIIVQGRTLSREENLELEKQLKLLNKPANTTILTIYGEKYDCIDFYKQPTFDHPALKNHNFHPEMSPSWYPERSLEHSSTTHESSFGNIWQNGKGCPAGTVPIKRTTRDDLVRAKFAAEIHASSYQPHTAGQPGTHYSVVGTKPSGKRYNGAGMTASIHKPIVWGTQYSLVQVKLKNEPDSIEVGWIVDPYIYKDNNTRLYIYTNESGSGCYNTYCPGFVLVRRDIPVDAIINQISQPGGPVYVIIFTLYRDPGNGNWWLQFGKDRTNVGYWPAKIFTGLANPATHAEWGGKVYSNTIVPSPPMGSRSLVIKGDDHYDAFCSNIVIIDESGNIVDAQDTATFNDVPEYQVIDKGIVNPKLGHQFFYGGGGGHTGD